MSSLVVHSLHSVCLRRVDLHLGDEESIDHLASSRVVYGSARIVK